jgi:glutamate-1-semialdehyde 2,1-aminomutase
LTPSPSSDRALIADTARRVLPAGGFGNTANDVVISEGRGGRVWDVDGNLYVDFLLGSGPMLLGHAHPDVTRAVMEQVPRGTTFFANNEHGIRLAEAIVEAVACADQVRFHSTGSEADLYAMRLARAYRGRDKILKFEGGYHGMSDYGLMSLWPKGPARFPQPEPDSAGIPASVRDEVLVAPFNNLEAAGAVVAEHHDDLAAVIVEPVQRSIPPKPGFLAGLRELATRHGIPLIFDEVVTGFRFAYGGAQEYFGVVPDLCSLGKVVGGGFPLAAVAGRAEIMAHFDRDVVGADRFVPLIGTLNGNPIAAVAGLAALDVLRRPGTYERIFATGTALMEGLQTCMDRAGVTARVVGLPPMFDIVFADGPMDDYRDTARGDADMLRRFNAVLRENGVLKGDTKFYVSLAHETEDIDVALAAFAAAAEALRP